MDKEDYIDWLEQQNGYCACPQLSELYSERKKAGAISESCDELKGKVDLENPKPEDLEFLKTYRKAVIDLNKQWGIYHSKLTQMIKKEQLDLFSHYPEKNKRERVKHRNLKSLLEQKIIVTAHCSNCQQQIDILVS